MKKWYNTPIVVCKILVYVFFVYKEPFIHFMVHPLLTKVKQIKYVKTSDNILFSTYEKVIENLNMCLKKCFGSKRHDVSK